MCAKPASPLGEKHIFENQSVKLGIMDAAHGAGYSGEDSAIHSAVYRLKTKLGSAGALLVSERRVGYRLVR